MAKKKINSRRKGSVGEVELGHELNRVFGVDSRRGKQYSGLEGKDVVGLEGIHVECKRVEKLNIDNAIDQAVRDAHTAGANELPVVFHRKNRRPWLVTLRLEDVQSFARTIVNINNEEATDVSE